MITSTAVTATMASLRLEDLSSYLPKELRERVYRSYLTPSIDQFTISEEDSILEVICSLQDDQLDLFEEIAYVAKRLSSVPQHINLDSKHEDSDAFAGFPKKLMTASDWLNVRYIVMTVKYYDASIRNVFGTTECPQISIPVEMATALGRVFRLQENNPHLGKLTKVRYNLQYDETHITAKDNIILPLSAILTSFPMAKTMWAEPIGSIEKPFSLDVIRAFNLGRRVFEKGHPATFTFLDLVIGVAERGATLRVEDFIIEERNKEGLAQAILFLGYAKAEDWMAKNGYNIEIQCTGCEANFKGDRPVNMFPEEKCLTRRLFKEHCQRSTKNHGGKAPCPYNSREHVELE